MTAAIGSMTAGAGIAYQALLASLVLLCAAPAAARVRVKLSRVAGGHHLRIAAPAGPIHVFRPPGYRRSRAGLVVYIHGYHISVDRTFVSHRLAEQFRASRQNALFIAVAAPTSKDQRVKYASLGQVLRLVRRHGRVRPPRGPIVLLAHSAGFRTAVKWLDHRRVRHVILLDALFSCHDDFAGWVSHPRFGRGRRLTLVGKKTINNCKRFIRRLDRSSSRRSIPARYADLSRRERRARVLYMRSQYGHSALVYNRKVIPLLLRRTRLRRVR